MYSRCQQMPLFRQLPFLLILALGLIGNGSGGARAGNLEVGLELQINKFSTFLMRKEAIGRTYLRLSYLYFRALACYQPCSFRGVTAAGPLPVLRDQLQGSGSCFFLWVCDWASINEGSNLYHAFPMVLGNKAGVEWLWIEIKPAAILYLSMLCGISIGWNVESFQFYCKQQFVVTIGKPCTSSVALSLHWRWRWSSFWSSFVNAVKHWVKQLTTVGKRAIVFLCSLDALGLWHVHSEPGWYIPHRRSLAHYEQTLPHLFEHNVNLFWSWSSLPLLQACGEWNLRERGLYFLSLPMPIRVVLLKVSDGCGCKTATGSGWAKGCPVASSSLSCSLDWPGSAHRCCSIVSSPCSQGTDLNYASYSIPSLVQLLSFPVCAYTQVRLTLALCF